MPNSKNPKNNIKILAIETSCDETAAAVIGVENNQPVILSNVVSSSVDLHAKTGGIVPEVASRAQMEMIMPVIAKALSPSQKNMIDYKLAIDVLQNEITHIAVTAGPGLIGSLLIGFNAAKTLAYAQDLPIIPINHIEGHLYSAFKEEFPIIALTVSGGHTMLVLMKGHGDYEIIGATKDDAVGEAYDKVARLLGLSYPGGPEISKLAEQFRGKNLQPSIVFPRPIMKDGTFNFSFSGLKTAVLVQTKKITAQNRIDSPENIPLEIKEEIAAAFEEAVADVLVFKTVKAIVKYSPRAVIFAGGVSANSYLAERLKTKVEGLKQNIQFLIPPKKMSGDNAAMIGLAAYYHIKNGDISNWKSVKVDANLLLR